MLGDPSCLGKDSLIHNTRHIPSRRRHLWISQLSSQHQASHVKVATTWKVEFPWPFGFVALKKKLKIHRTLQPNNSDVIFPKKKVAVSQRGSYMNKGTNKRTQKNRWRFRAWNLMIRAVSCWDLPPLGIQLFRWCLCSNATALRTWKPSWGSAFGTEFWVVGLGEFWGGRNGIFWIDVYPPWIFV